MSQAPGIYPGLSLEEYLAIDAANHTVLRRFSRSAAHAREEMLHPPEPSAAQALGQAFHMLLLEPGRYEETYAVAPQVDRRTRAGKEEWARWELEHPGRIVLSAEEQEQLAAMRVAVLSHRVAGDLIRARGAAEITAIWEHEGVRCKARIDRLVDYAGPMVVDLKTATDASPGAMARTAATYGYHSQAAFYLDGLAALDKRERRFVLVVVEKSAPYGVAVYEFDSASLEQGRHDYQRWLWLYGDARRTGVWPGYEEEILSLSIPRWARTPGLAEEF